MSEIKVDTVAEKTSANGVTVDGLNIKDSKLVTANSVVETNLTDNIVTLAKMASGTDGNIISYDASGNPVAIATGSDGQVLTSTGAGSPPAFEAAAAGGKVLQLVTANTTTNVTINTGTDATTGITAAITPSATSSKIFVLITGTWAVGVSRATTFTGVNLKRTIAGASEVGLQGGGINDYICLNDQGGSNLEHRGTHSISHVDSPNTTSACTYVLKARRETSGEAMVFNYGGIGSQITLIEIAG
jgi:hypothetical protein